MNNEDLVEISEEGKDTSVVANDNSENDASEIEKKSKETTIFDKLGNVSDKTISIIAMIAIGLMIVEPIGMSIYDICKKSVDLTLVVTWNVIRVWIFPTVSVAAFILYFLVFLRIRKENNGLLNVIKKNPLFIIFSLVVLLMTISQIYNGMESEVAGVPDYVRGESFDMQYSYFIFILFAATQVRLESHKLWLMRLHMLSSIIVVVAAFILWNTQVNYLMFYDWEPLFTSIYSNLNYYGYYLAVAVPIAGAMFIHEKKIGWKCFAIIAFIANTVALSINNSTGAWFGAAFGVLFISVAHLIIEKKINWQSMVIIFVFVIALYVPGHILGTFEENLSTLGGDITKVITQSEDVNQAGSLRIKLWKAGLDVVNDNKLFGIGFEGVLVRQYVGAPYMTRPHNEFLQYAMFYGIPMAVMYIVGCFGVFLRGLRKRKIMTGATLVSLSGTFGYLVSSFFGLTVFSTAMYLFVFMGMGYVREDESQKNIESISTEKASVN